MFPLTWDVDRVFVYVPGLHIPIYWYGLLFALGVYLSQVWLTRDLVKRSILSEAKAQSMIFILVVSIVIGARLGDIIFYQNPLHFLHHPLEVFNLRQGGLSSHGGFLGFLIGLTFFCKKYLTSFITLLSAMSGPAGLLACFIRLGNFFNQEILGKAYAGWGSVIFAHPFNGSAIIPRHPVQLYEALCYACLGFVFKKLPLEARQKTAWALISYFGVRIGLECFKESSHHLPLGMTMGMMLSIPIVAAGLLLLKTPNKQYKKSQ